MQGADKNGPTAVLKSASKIDHLRTGGTLLNMRFAPDFFDEESGKLLNSHLVSRGVELIAAASDVEFVGEKELEGVSVSGKEISAYAE